MPDKDQRPVMPCQPITTDGAPTDSQWGALGAHALRDVKTGEPPRYATSVKTAYDPAARLWFIRFDCDDPAWVSDYMERDETIWTQDVCEVFYDDAMKFFEYKELEVSPRNIQFDANITFAALNKFTTDAAWNIPWESRTVIDDAAGRLITTWIIPFDSLEINPAPGVRMPINFYRIDRGAEHAGGAEYSAWSPTWSGTFHDPYRFGIIEFA